MSVSHEKNKKVRVKLLYGMSLSYEYFCIFNQFKDIQFEIALDKNLIINNRGDVYYDKIKHLFLNDIKYFNNVKYVENIEEEILHWSGVEDLYFICLECSDSKDKLERFKMPLENLDLNYKNYIVLNTKVLWSNTFEYSKKMLPILKKSLEKNNTDIMLIGEKTPTVNNEYNFIGHKSIYNDIIENFDKVIDLTVNNTNYLYDIEIVKRNVFLLQNSKFNIHFGGGGGQIVFMFLNNTILIDKHIDIFNIKYWDNPHKCFQTTDENDFNNHLKELLNI